MIAVDGDSAKRCAEEQTPCFWNEDRGVNKKWVEQNKK